MHSLKAVDGGKGIHALCLRCIDEVGFVRDLSRFKAGNMAAEKLVELLPIEGIGAAYAFAAGLFPRLRSGGSATPYRSGTPALGMAVSAETALRLALGQQAQRIAHVSGLNQRLRAQLGQYPAVRFNSPPNAVPHILNLSVQGIKGTAFQRALGEQGVCVSVRSACAAEGAPSAAVYAVSHDRRNALSSWRISLSHLTTHEELTEFLQAFARCYQALVP